MNFMWVRCLQIGCVITILGRFLDKNQRVTSLCVCGAACNHWAGSLCLLISSSKHGTPFLWDRRGSHAIRKSRININRCFKYFCTQSAGNQPASHPNNIKHCGIRRSKFYMCGCVAKWRSALSEINVLLMIRYCVVEKLLCDRILAPV